MLVKISVPKYANPSSPMIKVRIGDVTTPNTLVDLGAAINLMTNETKERLSLQGLRPTPTVLQMADHSLIKLEGMIKDIIISIESWEYPTNFMILEPNIKLGGTP